MKPHPTPSDAQQVIRRISVLRDLCLRLSSTGYRAGLHKRKHGRSVPPSSVAETKAVYRFNK